VKIAELVGCLVIAAGVTALLDHLARTVWMVFPDRLQPAIYGWVGVGVFAVVLALVRAVSRGVLRRGTVVLSAAGLVVLAAGANQVNAIYGTYVTPRDLFGVAHHDDIALNDVVADVPVLPERIPVESAWSPSAAIQVRGRLTSATIPGQLSGFKARPAAIYLPPAYFSVPRPRLPVLVLLSGQPGDPDDWVDAGKLASIMNGFASRHRSLAPVVVVADATGSRFADPLCVDSRRGNAESYLAQDLPDWVTQHFTVDADPRAWAVAGASYGGTCALQLGTNHPEVYPTFLDISGSVEPTLGNRTRTVTAAFGGDAAAFARVNPLDLLATRRYPGSAARFVAGADDRDSQADARRVYAAATAAGMNTRYDVVPGSHDWRCFTAALALELPWLGQRMGLTVAGV
jgi:S-formylglutathione hydrolase FrmB